MAGIPVQYVECSWCIRNFRQTCTYFEKAIPEPLSIYQLVDQWTLERKEIDIDWKGLSACHGADWEPPLDFIRRHFNKPLDWSKLSHHSRVTDLIRLFPSKAFDLDVVVASPHVSIRWLGAADTRELLTDYRQFWDELSCNKALSEQDIEGNLDLPWSTKRFAHHSGLSLGFYQRNGSLNIDWPGISHLTSSELLSLLPKPISLEIAWTKAKTFEERARILLMTVRF
jgi:hypothetical protein